MTVASPTQSAVRPLVFAASAIGLIVGGLSLPVVLFAGGPLTGWVLAMVLWALNWGAQLAVGRLAVDMPATMAVGVSGISFIGRAWLTAIILFVVALKYSEPVGLTAAGVFLAAYTFDLMGRTLLFTVREKTRMHQVPTE